MVLGLLGGYPLDGLWSDERQGREEGCRRIYTSYDFSGKRTRLRPRSRLPGHQLLPERIRTDRQQRIQTHSAGCCRLTDNYLQCEGGNYPELATTCERLWWPQHHHGQHDESGTTFLGSRERWFTTTEGYRHQSRYDDDAQPLPSRRFMLPRSRIRHSDG